MHADYVMRIIHQFVKALVAIISARKAADYEAATEQIQAASSFFLKSDLNLLLTYTPEQLLEHFRNDPEQSALCADLFYELALVYEAKGFEPAARRIQRACLHLYLTAIPKDKQFQTPDYFEKVDALMGKLKELENGDLFKNFLQNL